MFTVRRLAVPLGLAALAVTPLPAAGLKGPPWISIELPANPYDRATRDAFLVVHAFHHGTPAGFPVTGVAEGLVNGERRTVALAFQPAPRAGEYVLRNQWGAEGEWTLVVTVTQPGENGVAQAMVQISGGEVISVRVPTAQQNGYTVPRRITRAEVERSLRDRPAAVVIRRAGFIPPPVTASRSRPRRSCRQ